MLTQLPPHLLTSDLMQMITEGSERATIKMLVEIIHMLVSQHAATLATVQSPPTNPLQSQLLKPPKKTTRECPFCGYMSKAGGATNVRRSMSAHIRQCHPEHHKDYLAQTVIDSSEDEESKESLAQTLKCPKCDWVSTEIGFTNINNGRLKHIRETHPELWEQMHKLVITDS